MAWFKGLLEKLSNAGTLAMLGYEIGTHTDDEHINHNETSNSTSGNHDTVIVVSGVVLIIVIVASMVTKIILAKRPVA